MLCIFILSLDVQECFTSFTDSSVKINVISEQVTPNLEYELGTAVDCALQLVKVKVQVWIP